MTADLSFEATAVVRSYSFEVEQRLGEGVGARNLSQALVEQRESGHLEDITSPWRSFFEANCSNNSLRSPVTEIVQGEAARLRDKWVAFYQKSPKAEKLDLRNFQPTISGVVAMVSEITSEWQTKRQEGRLGKAKRLFHRFCGTLDSHSSLLKLLPEGNEYVAIFAGTLNAIIKASANHEKIVEGLAEGLCTISEHVEDTDRDLQLSKSDDMLQLVADLYEHVFLFLSSVMDWIMEKRFKRLLDSFSESFNDRFEDEIRRINKKAERIRTFAMQSLTAETRVTRLLVEGLDRDIRLGLEGDKRQKADMQLFAERIERQLSKYEENQRSQCENMRKLGGAVVVLLETNASNWLEKRQLSPVLLRSIENRPKFSPGHVLYAEDSQIGPEDPLINSCHLEDHFSRNRVRLSPDDFHPMRGGSEVTTRLSEWSQGLAPPMLWLEGLTLEMDDFENPLTSIAAKVVAMVTAHQLNTISYFCEVPRTSRGIDTPEAEGVINLLYALLRQMVEMLPPRLDTTVDLSRERFEMLDGSLSTWKEAIELFRDLVSVLSGVVFCVVDGLHWLDGEATDACLAQLLTTLRQHKLRVLFTTSGRSGCLLDHLERDEILIADDLAITRDTPYDLDSV